MYEQPVRSGAVVKIINAMVVLILFSFSEILQLLVIFFQWITATTGNSKIALHNAYYNVVL